ncbi:MAG: type IV secretory system conjugative DNA transfer family protein, partial [Pseudomonadota bacterium]
MSFLFGNPFARLREVNTGGARILGPSANGRDVIVAAPGHSLVLAESGGGKTTKVSLPALFSFAADLDAAILILDSKNGEIAAQAAAMLHAMGRIVYVIDDLGARPELARFRIPLNPYAPAISAQRRDPRDVSFATDRIAHTYIEEPKEDAKNKYFRAWPRTLIEFALWLNLKRDPNAATPGAVSVILSDPEMLRSFAQIEAEEGDGILQSQAKAILEMAGHEHWPQHLEEAQRALRLFAPGTRLHDVGQGA